MQKHYPFIYFFTFFHILFQRSVKMKAIRGRMFKKYQHILKHLAASGAWPDGGVDSVSTARRVLLIDNGPYCVMLQNTEAQQGIEITQLHFSDVMRSRKSMDVQFEANNTFPRVHCYFHNIIFFNLSFTSYPESFSKPKLNQRMTWLGKLCTMLLPANGFFCFVLFVIISK